MTSVKRVGQVVGWIILLQMVIAPIVCFRMMTPLRPSDGLLSAAPFAPQLRLARVLVLLPGLLSLAAAVTAFLCSPRAVNEWHSPLSLRRRNDL